MAVSWLLAYRTVYNHPRDAFLLHTVCNCQSPSRWPLGRSTISKGCVSPALSMQMAVSWSLAYQTVYNHPRDAFLLLWVCNCWSPSYWPIGRSTIIQGMRSSCTGYAIVSTVYNHSKDAFLLHWVCSCQSTGYGSIGQFTIIQEMRFSCTEYAIIGTVFNHPRDAFLLHWVCSCQSSGC